LFIFKFPFKVIGPRKFVPLVLSRSTSVPSVFAAVAAATVVAAVLKRHYHSPHPY